MRRINFLKAIFLIVGVAIFAALASAQDARVTPLPTKDLAGIAGREVQIITVEYSPGASSDKHRHNANTFVYVLNGSFVMQVEGGTAATLRPGETFYESPTDVHIVYKNASKTQPARFLVIFIRDKKTQSVSARSQPHSRRR